MPRMRRLKSVAGLLTYYLVCNQPAPLFLSYCFALLRRFSLLLWSFLTWLFLPQDCCFVAGAAFGALWRRPVLGLFWDVFVLASQQSLLQPIPSKHTFVHFLYLYIIAFTSSSRPVKDRSGPNFEEKKVDTAAVRIRSSAFASDLMTQKLGSRASFFPSHFSSSSLS